MSRVHGVFVRFRNDRNGAIAIIFGFVLFALFGIAGIGLDSIRAHRVATRASSGLDAAALAAARALASNDSISDAELVTIARGVFLGNTDSFTAQGIIASTPAVSINRPTGTVTVSTNLQVQTTLAGVVGMNSLDFPKSSTVSFVARKVELAMVLDNTGSMNDNGKLSALKNAAKDIVDALIDPNKPNLSRISLAPYSAAVNVGPYATAASGGDSLDGCVMERLFDPDRDNDEAPGFPRNYAVKGQLNEPTNPRYVCPAGVLQPLTGDGNLLKGQIDGYTAGGATAGHIGLAWGWNTISPKWTGVFSGDAAPGPYNNSNVVKAVLLMSDGLFNTSFTAGESDSEQTAESQARATALCNNIKAMGVEIYTVSFQAPAGADVFMAGCASSATHAFTAETASELRDAFRDIAVRLQQLRISQ